MAEREIEIFRKYYEILIFLHHKKPSQRGVNRYPEIDTDYFGKVCIDLNRFV